MLSKSKIYLTDFKSKFGIGQKKPPKNIGGLNVIYLFLNAVFGSSDVFDYPFPV